jgi:hypothetical protein
MMSRKLLILLNWQDHGYSLGELNLNWDKRNVYDFDTRIHLLIKGPGITPGSSFDFLASNVDLTPTFLSLAGLERPPGMDGKSILPMVIDTPATTLVTGASEAKQSKLPGSVTSYLTKHPSAAVRKSWRTTHFIEYYYVGIGGYCGMLQPIEQPDNNFIALRTVGAGRGDMLYAEFQNGTNGNVDFAHPDHYELFDLETDKWQIHNLYPSANTSTKAALHKEVQAWLHCREDSCP